MKEECKERFMTMESKRCKTKKRFNILDEDIKQKKQRKKKQKKRSNSKSLPLEANHQDLDDGGSGNAYRWYQLKLKMLGLNQIKYNAKSLSHNSDSTSKNIVKVTNSNHALKNSILTDLKEKSCKKGSHRKRCKYKSSEQVNLADGINMFDTNAKDFAVGDMLRPVDNSVVTHSPPDMLQVLRHSLELLRIVDSSSTHKNIPEYNVSENSSRRSSLDSNYMDVNCFQRNHIDLGFYPLHRR